MLCSNCGNPLDPNDKFCKSCGTPINENPMNPMEQNNQMNQMGPMGNPMEQNNQINQMGPMGNPNDGGFQAQGPMMNNNFQQGNSFNQGPAGPAPMGNGYNAQEPKKNNTTFFIIVAVLVVVIVGLVLYFVLGKKDDKETPTTPNPDVVNPVDGNGNGNGNGGNKGGSTTQVTYDNVVKVDDYDIPLPSGFEKFEHEGKTYYYNSAEKIFVELYVHKSVTYNMYVISKDSLKKQLESMKVNVTNVVEKTFDGAKALIYEALEADGNLFYSFIEINNNTVLEVCAFSSNYSCSEMENKILSIVKNAKSSNSSSFVQNEPIDETKTVSIDAIKTDYSKIIK